MNRAITKIRHIYAEHAEVDAEHAEVDAEHAEVDAEHAEVDAEHAEVHENDYFELINSTRRTLSLS